MGNLFHNVSREHFYTTGLLAISSNPVWLLIYGVIIFNEDRTLENREALNSFLCNMERRAFRMAELATSNTDQAMEIVQDSMLALVKKYSHKNETDWGPLFHRILQSKIRDWYRRSKTRNSIFGIFSFKDEDNEDPIQKFEDLKSPGPEKTADNEQTMNITLSAIRALPLRQQQAFLLRAWEGYDVRETAEIMGCSQGSVKTHYSRATKILKHQLEAYQS
jgi:RNA polymerase sigma-70 factor (ECF subfamily)